MMDSFLIEAGLFLREAARPKYNLQAKFNEFNRKYFDNEIPSDVKVKWNGRLKRSAGRTKSTYNRETGEVIPKVIELATFLTDTINAEYLEEYYDCILIHEMTHAWVDVTYGMVDAHGHEFKLKMQKNINKGHLRFISPTRITYTYVPPELQGKVHKSVKGASDALINAFRQKTKEITGKYPTPDELNQMIAMYYKDMA